MMDLRPWHWGLAATVAVLLNVLVLVGAVRLPAQQTVETPSWLDNAIAVQSLSVETPAATAQPEASMPSPRLPESSIQPPDDWSPLSIPAQTALPQTLAAASPMSDFLPQVSAPIDPQLAIDPGLQLDALVYAPGDVDQTPSPISQREPAYPIGAYRRKIEGSVVVQLVVEPSGKVGEIEILRADPPGFFEETVMRTLKTWYFRPGRVGDQAVRVRMERTLFFELRSAKQ